MRLAYYAGASTAAAAACLLKAFHQRPNFYSATVYLAQSNACLLILTNLMLVVACTFMYALQRVLFGPLRPIEIEQLSEKAWYAVLDTLLAMPSFREDVGGWLLTMFVLLLAGKVWAWIGEGRVDILEQQPPANPLLFHVRLCSSLLLSVAFDVYMLFFCVDSIWADPKPGMMVIFTFEFAIQLTFSVFSLLRYALITYEALVTQKQTKEAIEARKEEIRQERARARQAATENNAEANRTDDSPVSEEEPIEVDENEVDVPGWEEKRRWLFALELTTDFIKLIIYITFFTVSVMFSGLPMHIMRDVYMTFASFSKRLVDFVAYRKATSDMNSRYPDATTEEIREDACIVCRETMVAWNQTNAQNEAGTAGEQAAEGPAPAARPRRRDEGLRAKKLPCGHILHLRCLKAWLERQQVCPTCRRPVITAPTNQAGTAQGGDQHQDAANQQRPRQGPNRARFFNLGPLRLGFVNGPQGQVQNIINQLNDPDAANRGVVPPANQQGPNHLGLENPYVAPQTGTHATSSRSRSSRRRSPVPMQVQLMQLEQRFMEEAHNLNVVGQQLTALRTMEAELARLRAQQIPARTASANPSVPTQGTRSTPASRAHMYGGHLYQNPYHNPAAQMPAVQGVLHGDATQQHGNGNQNLPDGLVLPEGWTMMPLRRLGDQPTQGFTIHPATGPAALAGMVSGINADNAANASAAVNGRESTPVTDAINATLPATGQQTQAGPTDDNGSPLFVPTQISEPSNADQNEYQQTHVSNVGESISAQPENPSAPWSDQPDWNFEDGTTQPTAAVPSSSQHNDPAGLAASTSEPSGSSAQQEGSRGHGTARAVEVEDAPDAES